jgi:cardiolipin synthase
MIFTKSMIFVRSKEWVGLLAAIVVMAIAGIILTVLYLVGQHLYRLHQYKKKELADQNLSSRINDHLLHRHPTPQEAFRHAQLDLETSLPQLILHHANFPLTFNRQVEILNNGEALYPRLFKKIEQAKRYVHLLFFIVQDDSLAHQLFDKLAEKSKQGVDVRLLVDGLGSYRLAKGGELHKLEAQGIKCAVFAPLKWHHLPSINFRNHRKIAVIDGQSGFIGGLNVGNEYLHLDPRRGYWRDIHVMIEGESALELERIFATDWYYATGELPAAHKRLSPTIDSEGASSSGSRLILAQVMPSGPDLNRPLTKESYLTVIREAKKRVWLGTPYFIPDQELLMALYAAKRRGVDVKLIVPERTDKRLVYYASFYYFRRLLLAGIPVYLYHKGFYHAKLAVIDEGLVNIGSANLDQRSFKYSFEAGLFIYDESVAQAMIRLYEQDLNACRLLTLDQLRQHPLWMKTATRLACLLSPWL